jgi:hypothetical protein
MSERTEDHARDRTDQLIDREAGRLLLAFFVSVMLVLSVGIFL